MMTSVETIRENLPLDKIDGCTEVHALECGSFLWASGMMDRLVSQARDFQGKTEKAAPQLKTGIHASIPKIWNSLPAGDRDGL